MAYRWAWKGYQAGGRPWGVSTLVRSERLFESAQLAREDLYAYLNGFNEGSTETVGAWWLSTAPDTAVRIIVVCPPSRAWAVYPVQDGLSIDQAGEAVYNSVGIGHRLANQVTKNHILYHEAGSGYVMSPKDGFGLSARDAAREVGRDIARDFGCVARIVMILGAVGAKAAAWARGRWGF